MDTMNIQRVTIDGIVTHCTDVRTNHGKDQPIGSGSVTIPGPMRSHVQPATPVRIELGYGENVDTVFLGQTSDDTLGFTDMGHSMRVALEGYGKRLWYALETEEKVAGPIGLHTVFNTFAAARQVPHYLADPFVDVVGDPLTVAGISKVDGGAFVTIDAESSPGAVIDRIARLFGYATFDTPNGWHRFMRISGIPSGTPVRTYTEGVDILRIEKARSLKAMVNAWEIVGASWTGVDGEAIELFSRSSGVPLDPRLGPTGKNKRTLRDDALVTQRLCDVCREVMEIDYAAPQDLYSVDIPGDAGLQPGDAITLAGPTVDGTVTVWVTDIAHASSGQGWTTSLSCWAGRGEATPSPVGGDCVTVAILSGTRHLGDSVIATYARPNPDGLTYTANHTAASKYRSLSVAGRVHGASSRSRIELRQGGVVKASGAFPQQTDDSRDYTDPSHWPRITVPLNGAIDAGATEVRIISGIESTGGYDDLEVRDLTLRLCGAGSDTPRIIFIPPRPRS
jgi:hypothetical protein